MTKPFWLYDTGMSAGEDGTEYVLQLEPPPENQQGDWEVAVWWKDYERIMVRGQGLEEALRVAMEALELYTNIAGDDCKDSTTQYSAAAQALAKIKELTGE